MSFPRQVFTGILLALLVPGTALASLVWDFTITGDLAGEGHFEVNTPNFTDAGATMSIFTFNGTVFGNAASFNLGDLLNLPEWEIDETNWSLSHFTIITNNKFIDQISPLTSLLAIPGVPAGLATATCQDAVNLRCNGSDSDFAFGSVTYHPVEPVPTPTSALLFVSGLLGLAGYRWAQRRREGQQPA